MPKYTVEQAATVVRGITNLLIGDDKFLKNVGILRLSGAPVKVDEIFSQALSGKEIQCEPSDFADCTSAMKQVLSQENEYLTPTHPLSQQFQEAVKNSNTKKFKEFVDNLIKSTDPKDQLAGEIIYRYLHLGKEISNKSDINKMTQNNVARIMATLFVNCMRCIDIPQSLEKSVEVNNKIITLIEAVLQSKEFDMRFEKVALAKAVQDLSPVQDKLRENMDTLAKLEGQFKDKGIDEKKYKKGKKEIEKENKSLQKEIEEYKALIQKMAGSAKKETKPEIKWVASSSPLGLPKSARKEPLLLSRSATTKGLSDSDSAKENPPEVKRRSRPPQS